MTSSVPYTIRSKALGYYYSTPSCEIGSRSHVVDDGTLKTNACRDSYMQVVASRRVPLVLRDAPDL